MVLKLENLRLRLNLNFLFTQKEILNMPRAIWKGTISFGLVSIPVKVYSATEPKEVQLHELCPDCCSPLQHKRWCPKCEKEIKWSEVKKGFKVSKDKWVVIEKKDLQKIKLPSTKTIEIKQFVDITQIDPIYFEKTYYVVPDEGGEKAYSLFVEALRLANRAAIGKVVMRNKEYVVCLRPYRKGLSMHLLYFVKEIRDINELPELKNLVVVRKEELELAKALIDKLTEKEFDISEFKDEYTEALKKLIKAKVKGEEFEIKERSSAEEAKNLLEALKVSIQTVKKKKR